MSTRIGVDIGGTFTDLVYYDDSDGSVVVAKVPTTPASPEKGCINAIDTGVPPAILADARYFLHGTTVGLNALLERKGATIGMLTTAGFRDVLEIRDGSRGEPYNAYWRPQQPLVRRELRLPVRERATFDGRIEVDLVEQDVIEALARFREAGVSSIAVVFLHSYANPRHELAAAKLLRDAGFDGHISLSHQVSGEYRDYERASTTAIDAFVRARMAGYLNHISDTLDTKGFDGTMLMTRSGSGSMTFAEAQDRPFETIMSGPVAGAEGAAELAKRWNLPNLITADVGGTSFDACLIVEGRPKLLHSGEVAGMPIQSPWIDVRSIGAGGGSIAKVDVGGFLTVGPESAGAQPGPACYGRGGERPTVTDAVFYLGMLGEGALASGLRLDREAAGRAIDTLSGALNYSTEQTAKGIVAIAAGHMANLIRELTIEQGIDPRAFKLLPFGGAGPMMATQIARELDISDILVPPHAGNFSAWGLLGADLMRSRSLTRVMPLNDRAMKEVDGVLAGLIPELRNDASLKAQDLGDQLEVALELRFAGQEYTLSIKPKVIDGQLATPLEGVKALFVTEYERRYGISLGNDIELVTIRVSRRQELPRRNEQHVYEAGGEPTSGSYYSFAEDRRLDFACVQRGDITPLQRFPGPAIITEPTTTTYVDADFTYGIDATGCLLLQRMEK